MIIRSSNQVKIVKLKYECCNLTNFCTFLNSEMEKIKIENTQLKRELKGNLRLKSGKNRDIQIYNKMYC